VPDDGFDMGRELFDQLIEELSNGDEVSVPHKVREWRKKEGRILKLLYRQQSENRKAMREFKEENANLLRAVSDKLDLIVDNPPVTLWIKQHLAQTGAIIVAYSVFMLVVWLALYILVQDPAVALWLHQWLGIPELGYLTSTFG
jgi:hypothetical protein